MEKLLGEKITPAKFTDLNRTGFWLKVPGKSGGVNKSMLGKWMLYLHYYILLV